MADMLMEVHCSVSHLQWHALRCLVVRLRSSGAAQHGTTVPRERLYSLRCAYGTTAPGTASGGTFRRRTDRPSLIYSLRDVYGMQAARPTYRAERRYAPCLHYLYYSGTSGHRGCTGRRDPVTDHCQPAVRFQDSAVAALGSPHGLCPSDAPCSRACRRPRTRSYRDAATR
jgi:hypothetical protein